MLDVKVTLRITSKVLSLDRIISVLGKGNANGFSIGDTYARNRRIRQHSAWYMESDISQTEPTEKHIKLLLLFVEENIEQIEQLREDCEIDLFCFAGTDNGQGAIKIPVEVSKQISEFKLPLLIDIHAT